MPPVLDVIECVADDQCRQRFRDVLQNHFRANLYPVETPEKLRLDLFPASPDLLLVDQTFLSLLRRDSNSAWKKLREKATEMSVVGIEVEAEQWGLDYGMYGYVEPGFSSSRIIQLLEKAALSQGYMVAQGKVDSRLVQKHVPVELTFESEDRLLGYTTGLNINGCGVRINEEPRHLRARDACRVKFLDTQLSASPPVRGIILEVAPNWINEQGAYLRIKFDDPGFVNDSEIREILDAMIREQEDRSVRKRGREHRGENGRPGP